MVKIKVTREPGIRVVGELEGKTNELMTELVFAISDCLKQLNIDYVEAKKMFILGLQLKP